MANAVRPGAASPSAQRPLRQGDTYQPAVTPAVSDSLLTPRTPMPGAALGTRSWGKAPPRGPGFPFLGSRRVSPFLALAAVGLMEQVTSWKGKERVGDAVSLGALQPACWPHPR